MQKRLKEKGVAVLDNILDDSPKEKSMLEGELPIILIQEYEIVSHIMGYHEYQRNWIPFVGEELTCRMEPVNVMEKYAVAVINNDAVVGHLMKEWGSSKFAKTIFYFLRSDDLNSCTAVVTGRAVNKKDGKGIQIPCKLTLSGSKIFIEKRVISIRCIFVFNIKSIC